MSDVRPCLACGHDNEPSAGACARCGGGRLALARTSAWPMRRDVAPALRRAMVGAGVVVLALVAAALVWRFGGLRPRPPEGPTWRNPATMVAWADTRLDARGVPAEGIRAVVETSTSEPRRVLVTEHDGGQDPAALLRAGAELLLEAREGGEATATNLLVIRHATAGLQLVEIGEAARLAKTLPVPSVEAGDTKVVAAPAPDAGAAREAAGELAVGEAMPTSDGEMPKPPPSERPPVAPVPAAAARLPAEGATSPASSAAPALASSGRPAASPVAPAPQSTATSAPAAPAPPPARAKKPESDQAAAASKPVRLLRGPGPLIQHRVAAGTTGVIVLRAQLHPAERRSLLLRSVAIASRGSGDEAGHVEFVQLVHDVDRDGRRGAEDPVVGGPLPFGEDDGRVVFAPLDVAFGATGVPLSLLLVVDFVDAEDGGTFLVSIPDGDAVIVEDVTTGQPVPVAGAPLNGTLMTLTASVPKAPTSETSETAEQGEQGEQSGP